LDTDRFLGGSVKLDRERMMVWMEKTRGPIATVEDFAAGIVQVIETSMAKAIRVISVERGYDPRDFTLVAFGGGGPVHACSLAHTLRVPRVLVPALPGALSAVGILLADTMREYSRTVMLPINALFEDVFSELEKLGTEEFRAENLTGESFRSVDVRYHGQGYELNVPFGPEMAAQFHDLHQRRYGFANETRALEVVNVRVRMVSAAEAFTPVVQPLNEGDGSHALIGTRHVYFDGSFQETRVYDRELLRPGDTFAGPAIVSEYSSATVLPFGDVLRVDGLGNLVIEVHG
jgi:N-methylhydantoinase A